MDEVETAWQKIKTNIIGAAAKALGKRKCNTKAKGNATPSQNQIILPGFKYNKSKDTSRRKKACRPTVPK
ncbi:hypothetical protein M0804_015422 [Polistes exclamans]|nr:hypothetical protein M0804_015422 [Polistes exclamans]